MKNTGKFIQAWSQQPLGVLIRDWWNARLHASLAKPQYLWSDEDQEAVTRPDAVRVCHRCLTSQERHLLEENYRFLRKLEQVQKQRNFLVTGSPITGAPEFAGS